MSAELSGLLGIVMPEQLAQVFDCTPGHIEEQLRNRELPGVKVGRGWSIQIDALRQHLAAQALANVAPAPAPIPAAKPSHAPRGKRKELLP
jgi:hypothetical protein